MFVLSFRSKMVCLMVFCLLLAFPAVASEQDVIVGAGMNECSQLRELDSSINIEDLVARPSDNPDEPDYEFRKEGSYFCGTDAPSYIRCKCGIASVCFEKMDPWGRNMGECGCCTTWVIVLFGIFGFVVLTVLLGGLYACLCHGTWLYDGFPSPIMPLLPQRSATIIAPASFPLPEHAFRPYRSTDFISSDDPATIAGSIAAAAFEPPPAETRRRRRNQQQLQQQQQQQAALAQQQARALATQQQRLIQQAAPPAAEASDGVTARHRANVTVHMASPADVRRPLMMASPQSDSVTSQPEQGLAGGGGPAVPMASAPGSAGANGANPPPQPQGSAAAGGGNALTYSPTNSDDGAGGARRAGRGVPDDIEMDPML